MAFSRDDLTAYETQPQTNDPKHDPWGPRDTKDVLNPEADPQANAEASSEDPSPQNATEPAEQGNDGSTTDEQAEPVAAESANPEGEKDPEQEDLSDGKPRNRAQERIEELVAERNALRKYGEYLLTQVDELRKSPKGAQPNTPTAPVSQTETEEDPVPTLESAEFDPVKFAKLQNEWIQKQVDKRVNSAFRQIETRQSEQAVQQAFAQRTVEFKKAAPDFDLVISNPALPSLSSEAARVVIKSDNGPAIAYHLAKNPDLAARISRMEPVSQAAAIGRLEEQLIRAKADVASTQGKEPSKDTKPKQANVTKAPPPPKPVSSGSGVVSKPDNLLSMEEWVANERNRKIAEKSARRKMRDSMR